MNNIAIIPARSGSKGLTDKNILPLKKRPLLAWSIDAALESGMFDTVHVSTDSEKYAKISLQYGADVPFLRSTETSTDNASTWDVMLEVLEKYRQLGKFFDTVTLLQPTSPLRTSDDIRYAFQLMKEKNAEAIVSVCEVDHSPLWCNTLPENRCMDGFLASDTDKPRQALKTYYRINGALYLLTISAVQKWKKMVYGPRCYAHIMPQNRSVDIDTSFDFLMVEQLLRWNKATEKANFRASDRPHKEDNIPENAPPPRTPCYKYLFTLRSYFYKPHPSVPCWNNYFPVPGSMWRTFQVKGAPAC